MTALEKNTIQVDFETLYLRLRVQERRIYSDEEIAQLPIIASSHRHYKEWQIRNDSSQKLINYLQKRKHPNDILEIGCGNGWLSHRLSAIPGSRVIGTDINFLEIQQAARVFQNITNLHFIYAPVDSEFFKEKGFDTVVFAASLQYFESLTGIINSTLRLLKPGGEIHIIDTPFYPKFELLPAKQRSRVYFETAGFPEMVNYYFHHCLDDLKIYNYSILRDPKRIFNKFSRQKNPFYWIRIQQQ